MKRAPLRRGKGFAVTAKQRKAIEDRACLYCHAENVDPAHLIDRSLCADLGDERAVVPLCRRCHGLYDDHKLDLLASLEPHFRAELAFAVERFGLINTLQRVTGLRWLPEDLSKLDWRQAS